MSLPLCRASSKMSVMPSGATQRSDTKVQPSLTRNTPGRFESRHVCPSQRVHSSPATNGHGTGPKHCPALALICADDANAFDAKSLTRRSRQQETIRNNRMKILVFFAFTGASGVLNRSDGLNAIARRVGPHL